MKVTFENRTLTAKELAFLCGGTVKGMAELPAAAICTDSSEASDGTVFCALKGERTDGHRYIPQAAEHGCRCILCERIPEELSDLPLAWIVTDSTDEAILKLGESLLRSLPCKRVGITGSVGKTTAKDLIASVLAEKYSTYRTQGNRNSLVGMPLSAAEIPMDADWAVLEMGMSGAGEIEALSKLAAPDIAVITNIGSSHMEMLGSRENIRRAKLEILCGLKKNGLLLLNGDDPMLKNIGGKNYQTACVSLKNSGADCYASNIRTEGCRTCFDITCHGKTERDFCLNMMGNHNIYAALFAFAVGREAGLTAEQIRQGLAAYRTEGLRQNLTACGKRMFFEDCYNAAPESVMAALDVLKLYREQNRMESVAVLGDMLELGTETAELHRNIGTYAVRTGISKLVAVGELAKHIVIGAEQAHMALSDILYIPRLDDPEAAAKKLESFLPTPSAVLFKASRAMGLERMITNLKNDTEQ